MTNNDIEKIELDLSDIQIEDIVPVELGEDVKGHPENLASTKWCCCCISSLPTLS